MIFQLVSVIENQRVNIGKNHKIFFSSCLFLTFPSNGNAEAKNACIGRVVQWIECLTTDQVVPGSSPGVVAEFVPE